MITGPQNTMFKLMPQDSGAAVPIGMVNGYNGAGHQSGPTTILWSRNWPQSS